MSIYATSDDVSRILLKLALIEGKIDKLFAKAIADSPPDGRTIIDPPPNPPMSPINYGPKDG